MKKEIFTANGYKFLHEVAGYDFQAPHTIIERSGSFTLNSIRKIVDPLNTGVINDLQISLFVLTATGGFRDSLHYVTLTESGFISKDTIPRRISYYRKIRSFYSKGEFEEARKNANTRYYIIIQRKEQLKLPKAPRKLDISERYSVKDFTLYSTNGYPRKDYIGNVDLKSLEYVNDGTREYDRYNRRYTSGQVETTNIYDIVDKSGYIVEEYRAELKRRAKALIAERKAAAARMYDCTAQTQALESRIRKIRAELSRLMLSATYSTLGSLPISDFRRFLYSFEEHKEKLGKTYRSISDIDKNLESLDKELSGIERKLFTSAEENADIT